MTIYFFLFFHPDKICFSTSDSSVGSKFVVSFSIFYKYRVLRVLNGRYLNIEAYPF